MMILIPISKTEGGVNEVPNWVGMNIDYIFLLNSSC